MPSPFVGGSVIAHNGKQLLAGANPNRTALIVSTIASDPADIFLDDPDLGGQQILDNCRMDTLTINRRNLGSEVERPIWAKTVSNPGDSIVKTFDISLLNECLENAYDCLCLGVRSIVVPTNASDQLRFVMPGNGERLTLIVCENKASSDFHEYSPIPGGSIITRFAVGRNTNTQMILKYCIHGQIVREPVWLSGPSAINLTVVTEVYRIP